MVLTISLLQVGAAALLLGSSQAAPSGNLVKRDDFQSGKTDYTVEQIQNTFMVNKNPIKDKCVFYTGAFVGSAKAYQAKAGLESLYTKFISDTSSDRFPFDDKKDPQKSYVENNPNLRREWFSITSRAYAALCEGTVYHVWDKKKPFSTGGVQTIWLTDELPQLRQNGKVTSVKLVIPDTANDPKDWTVEEYPNWQDKKKDDPSPSNNPSNRDTPGLAGTVKQLLSGSSRRLMRRALSSESKTNNKDARLQKRDDETTPPTPDDDAKPPTPNDELNVSGTLFTGSNDGFILGTCAVYLRQFKLKDKKDGYGLGIDIFDGANYRRVFDTHLGGGPGYPVSVSSTLPQTVFVEPQVDTDVLKFTYGDKNGSGYNWKSDDDNCLTGKYVNEDGTDVRNVACKFTC